MLVGGVGVQRECPFIVAEVAGIEGAEQTVALDGEPLAIGRRAAAVTPDPAQGQLVMVIDQDRVRRLECRFAQEPAAGILQLFGGDGIDALRHGGEAEIGAVGDQGGEQRGGADRRPAVCSRRAAERRW